MAATSGELDVPGLGRLRPATFTRTDGDMFAYGMFQPGHYRVSVLEWGSEPLEDNDNIPLTELGDAVKRVLGADLPMSAPVGLRRLVGVNSRQAAHYRCGGVFLVGDAGPGSTSYESERHPVGERVIMQTRAQMALLGPGPNITALRELMIELLGDKNTRQHVADLMAGANIRYETKDSHPMPGRWLPDLVPDNGTRIAELMRAARPVLLTRTGHTATGWTDRIDVVTTTADLGAAAVLVRPDGYVAWAGDTGLTEALRTWFGDPR